MNILEIRTLRGPTYWSGYWKQLIIMRLDIEDYEDKPTDKLEGFYERLVDVLPSLISHGCSYQEQGGFWKASSLNKTYAADSMEIRFMQDAATAFASMALVSLDGK